MITESSTAREIREGIITDTKSFLIGLESGASEDQLRAVLQRIREKELRLLKEGGTMLDPKIWSILLNRLAQRDNQEIIDTTQPSTPPSPVDPGSDWLGSDRPGSDRMADNSPDKLDQ
jgi:hypothetical protein